MSLRPHCDYCGDVIELNARYMRLRTGIATADEENLSIDASEPDDICERCVRTHAADLIAKAWADMQSWGTEK